MGHIPYFSFYPADFMNGIRGLSAQEVGVYTMLLCRIYEENGPIENHALRLATYCGMRVPTFEKTLSRLIELGKIKVVTEGLFNDRAGEEIQKRSDGLKNNSKAGKASAEKRQQNQATASTTVQQPFNHTDTDTDTDTDNTEDKSSLLSANNGDEDYRDFLSKHPKPRDSEFGLTAWRAAIAAGADPKELTAAAARYADASKHFDRDKVKFSDNWLTAGGWEKHPPPKVVSSASEAEIMAFWAKAINGTGFIAQSSISPALASKIVAAGLVTPDQMKKRGIAA